MTWIEATCPTCGTVDCAPSAFTLAICSDAGSSFYRFTCPMCGALVQKHADARVTELLIAEGVNPIEWHLPAEILEHHQGPVISMDDVLDLHLLLEHEDWFDEFTQTAS